MVTTIQQLVPYYAKHAIKLITASHAISTEIKNPVQDAWMAMNFQHRDLIVNKKILQFHVKMDLFFLNPLQEYQAALVLLNKIMPLIH